MKQQEIFIGLLKRNVPSNINLAEDMGQVLQISSDSAYRRIRCETALTLDETVKLCNHFDIPLDVLNHSTPNSISFKIHKLSNHIDSFIDYLEALGSDIGNLTKYENGEIIYAAEDLPVFYSFFFKELARFKLGYWNKSIQNVEELQGTYVEDLQIPAEWQEKVQAIVSNFLQVNSIEIWNEDTLKSTLRQVKFYWEAGFFKDIITFKNVCNDLIALITKVQKQTEINQKLDISGASTGANFTFYQCDLMIGNNTVLASSENFKTTFIGYNSFNFMNTQNSFFNQQNQTWLDNLISKSILMSGVAEKLRNQFFKAQIKKIEMLMDKIDKEEN